ncbi:acyltransferase family protein [Novosphingobium album (ex Liu et al. 2023)]|uniref:Acyltransferase family protein n=1 Tax=Novosphingobium album (ex Liu et al. 2023) TaxID=3031130 RepID=A0ABT5WK95_9SPHN|nr:acyltransferase family protein [Novosphingobium album (ex Liu et al. 2023)]MDE8650463.1 acyltransferase family protein [Novosphingobium album (ex Liu et al. 2023)]
MTQERTRRDDIQGLRAIAVVSVLLFHALPRTFPGGFIGVDVFFVISGYLITGIIHREAMEGRFSFANFYSRRIRRIFPALFAMLVPTLAVGIAILSPDELQALARSTIAAIFSVSNIYFWRTSGYFATAADFLPLLHTWSLGVEEQFYIFLPVVVLAVVRFARGYAGWIFAAAFVASLALSQAVLHVSASASYFLLPTRSFELLAGSILAVARLPLPSSPHARNAMGLAGIALMIGPVFAFSEATPFPGLNALYPTIGAALVLHAGSGAGRPWASRLISTSGFRFFGDISYSLYLWHWPILAYLRVLYGNHLPSPLAGAALMGATALAFLSYRFIEQPILRWRAGPFPFVRAGALAMACGSLAVVPILLAKGFPARFPARSLALFDTVNDHNPVRARCHNDGGAPRPYARNCIFGDQGNDRLIAVWGDSHGAELAYALGQQSRELGRNVIEVTASNCPPALDYRPADRPNCIAHNRAALDAIIADSRVDTVILAANGISYDDDPDGFRQGFEAAMTKLRDADKTLLVVTQFPWFQADPPIALGYAAARGEELDGFGRPLAEYESGASQWNRDLADMAARTGARLVSTTDALCPGGFCPMHREGVGALYFNKNHVSLRGARQLTSRLVPLLRSADDQGTGNGHTLAAGSNPLR